MILFLCASYENRITWWVIPCASHQCRSIKLTILSSLISLSPLFPLSPSPPSRLSSPPLPFPRLLPLSRLPFLSLSPSFTFPLPLSLHRPLLLPLSLPLPLPLPLFRFLRVGEPAADAAPAAVAVPPPAHLCIQWCIRLFVTSFFRLVNGCSDNADHYVFAEQRGSEGERERRKEAERKRGEESRESVWRLAVIYNVRCFYFPFLRLDE